MKILVTGGMGLIGHNVVSKLENLGHDVIIVDNKTNYSIIPPEEIDYLMGERSKKIKTHLNYKINISDKEKLETVFVTYKPDIVIHLASFPRQKVVNVNPAYASTIMIQGLLHLLELSVKYNVNRFVYISSSMVYGDFEELVAEEYNCKPQGQYGIMKLAGEWLTRDYTRKYQLDHTIIRPSAVYGPLDVEDRVISKFLLNAMRGLDLIVNGPDETLDFTFVDDAAYGIVAATLSSNARNKTYNITKSHSKTLLEAAKLAIEIVGKGNIKILGKDRDFPSRGALDISKAKKDFGYDPKVDVEDGFKIYYDWLKTSSFY